MTRLFDKSLYLDDDGRWYFGRVVFPSLITRHRRPGRIQEQEIRSSRRHFCPIDVISRALAERSIVVLHWGKVGRDIQ